nr:MAG TPA: hypothetical protein [Caudoviricetes sp.]
MSGRFWLTDDVIEVHCESYTDNFQEILGDIELDKDLYKGITEELKQDEDCISIVLKKFENGIGNLEGIRELDNSITNMLASKYLSEVIGREIGYCLQGKDSNKLARLRAIVERYFNLSETYIGTRLYTPSEIRDTLNKLVKA